MMRYLQNGPRTWAFQVILAAAALTGCEARPRPWANEIPTATAVFPSTAGTKILRPTPFNFVQAFVEKRLKKRDEYPDSVCGFIGGDVASPAVCSSDSVCLWDQAHGAVGCSATEDGGDLAVYTTCVDSNNDDIASLQNNPWAFTCSEECFRNSYESISDQGFTQWGCGASDSATTVLTQPSGVDNQSAKVSLTSIDMTTPSSSSSAESSTSTSSSSSSQPPSSTTSSEDSSSTNPPSSTSSGGNQSSTTSGNPSSTSSGSTPTNSTGTSTPVPPNDSSTNVGAIAGGVVGGVAGLALIAGLLLLLRRRNNKEKLKRVSGASGSNLKPHDMGDVYEPKELDATTPQIPSELPGDSPMVGPSKPAAEPAELPGSEVPMRPEPEKKV
ncbi:uncharacterized protein DFL_002489 [Arthrobotrys flagrans]|uniref:Mid2 domain-containing protein n=1 Tax=Arthrobotrys flagrans TaxID=97331 RepID=A0A437ABX0_ARTFL|nr:hypothetical protein DFL_002489 [Arthrobotrys flagrans]